MYFMLEITDFLSLKIALLKETNMLEVQHWGLRTTLWDMKRAGGCSAQVWIF